MYIVFFIIIIFVLGIIFSKVIINLEKIEINQNNIKFKIKVKLLWFCFLPIFILSFDENGIKIFWKNINYKKLFKTVKKDFKNNDFKKLKKLKIQTNLAKFTLKIGTEDIFITTFLVTIISTILSIIFEKTMKNINYKKMNYYIFPEFNKNEIYFEGQTNISFKILNLKNLISK